MHFNDHACIKKVYRCNCITSSGKEEIPKVYILVERVITLSFLSFKAEDQYENLILDEVDSFIIILLSHFIHILDRNPDYTTVWQRNI